MDIEKLKKYVDEHILNQVDYRRKYDEKTGEEYYFTTVKLSLIEKKIPEELIPTVFEYLKSKNIYVIGNSYAVYGEFDNYIYSNRKEESIHLPKAMSKDEFDTTIKKYKECSDEKEKKLLRNKLIEGNLRLVNKVIMDCYRYRELDQEELRSYGYEGLIRAIDNYSSDKGIFSTFAMSYIDGYIKSGLSKIRNIKNVSFFFNYLNCKKSLETELGYQIKNNEEFDYLDDIIDIYMEVYASNRDTKENLKRRIYLSEFLPLDDNLLVEDFSDKVINDVFMDQVHEDIINSIEKLRFSSKLAIYHLYEVDSLKKQEVDSIIKNLEYDVDYIRKAKAKAINKLKKDDCLKKDLEEFGTSTTDKKKQKTKRKTWNNVIYMV